jgi:1-phosphatidylinositol-3-phosphate 5-kinase
MSLLCMLSASASMPLCHWLCCVAAQVKRLPDVGAPDDSCVVKGVVAKKNVAHRRMRTDIDDPAVLLLSGALEYQRVANKLSSFDTLLDQEREHLRLAVARIAACK